MKYNSDFKYDLKVGQVGEKYLGNILENKTIEVKTDYKASETGNIFIEYFSRGKPSGLAISKSDWYAFIISNDNIILIKTDKLKDICRKYFWSDRDVKGGDNNTSQGILLNLKEII